MRAPRNTDLPEPVPLARSLLSSMPMLTSLDIDPAHDRLGVWPFLARTRSYSPSTTITIEPELILPEQFDGLRHNGSARPPELRLMLAVLEDAVHTYQSGCDSRTVAGRRLFREAEEWFRSDETASPFSFVTICQVWGVDPDYVRVGLRRWRTRHDPRSRATPFRMRRVTGSRHQITLSRAARRHP